MKLGLQIMVGVATVGLVLGLLPWWPLSLIGHFRVQALLVFVLLSGLAAVLGDRRSLAAAGTVTILLAAVLGSYSLGAEPATKETMRLLMININAGNRNHGRLKQLVAEEKPDVLVVLEVRDHLVPTLEELDFAHRSVVRRQDNFGIAVLSQFEPEQVRDERFGPDLPTLVIDYPGWRLIATHPYPPVSRRANQLGSDQTEWLTRFVSGDRPVVLAGDLNDSSWGHRVARLRRAGLRNCRHGFGVLPSWPAEPAWLRIPIDHFLASPEFRVSDFRIGPDVDSDHFPLLVELGLK